MTRNSRFGAPRRTLLHGIVLVLLAFVALPKAHYYGSIWDIRAHPSNNVTVTMPKSSMLQGSLSREWDGRFVLISDDGALKADVTRAHAIAFSPTTGEMRSMHDRWRSWVPAGAVLILALGYLLVVFSRPLRA